MSTTITTTAAWADVHRTLADDRDSAMLLRSCAHLKALDPDYPRMYAVASMAAEGKRRWWPLEAGLADGRVDRMFRRSLDDLHVPNAAAEQVAKALIHAVVGRVTSLLVLDARAWDPGIDNLWIHMDSDDGIDWAGVASPLLRVLPGDRISGERGTVTLPCEEALVVWTAHRCLTSLNAVHRAIDDVEPLDPSVFWSSVGEAVLGVSTLVPLLARSSASEGARRGQAFLDALDAAGAPVRARAVRTGRRNPLQSR